MKKNINLEYYHISPVKNLDSILSEGIKSEDKEIFVCDNETYLPIIASSQLFTNEYSIFKISNNGITGKIIQDEVAELCSKNQYIILQNVIKPEHIVHMENVIWNIWELNEHVNRLYSRMLGLNEELNLERTVWIDKEWCLYYNKKYNKAIACIID
ncbi:MAG: hypothetical protein PHW29_01120 [Flavobacterium sp.]|nr:hypothetical protein [Flavobacterium sp.]